MSGALEERTLLPPSQVDYLRKLRDALGSPGHKHEPALIARDGSRVDLPDELFDVLHDVVNALSEGFAITVAPKHTVLTTGEAADFLGISRPTLIRLLDSGEIPYEQPARHRKLRLDDVLAYQERTRRARAAGLDEMVRNSEDGGIYDMDITGTFERPTRENNEG